MAWRTYDNRRPAMPKGTKSDNRLLELLRSQEANIRKSIRKTGTDKADCVAEKSHIIDRHVRTTQHRSLVNTKP